MDNYKQIRELVDTLLSNDIQGFYDKLNYYTKNINTKKPDTQPASENNFYDEIKPGRIVVLEVKGEKYFGFILTGGIIIYTNEKGEIKGYLKNYTSDHPYKIEKILIPTKECYQLQNYKSMTVAWTRPSKPVIVTKTISELEKELNLEPGSLQIVK